MKGKEKNRLFAGLSVLGLVFLLDWVSKRIVVGNNLSYVINSGGAFSIFSGSSWFNFLVWIVFAGLVISFLMGGMSRVEKLVWWGLWLVIGGSLGNIADRVVYGGVVDFLSFGFLPVFNLADVAIVVGMLLIVLGPLVFPRKVS